MNMDNELNQLEAQLERLIGAYGAQQTENRDLHVRVARLEAENHRLTEKLQFAIGRIEAALNKLPEA